MTFDENGKHTETTTGKTTDGKDVEITTVYEEIKDETGKVISYTKTVTTRELTPKSTTIEETGRTDVKGAEKLIGERQPDGRRDHDHIRRRDCRRRSRTLPRR